MKKYIHGKEFMQVLKLVFSQPKYLIGGIIIFLIMFSFNLLVSNASVIWYAFMNEPLRLLILILNLLTGSFNNMIWHSKITLILISVLTAIVLPLIIFKIKAKVTESKRSNISIVGISLGLFTSGCASCGVGLAAALGFSGTLAALPFAGLEIAVIGIALLSLSTYWLAGGIYHCESCQVQLESMNK